MNSLPLLMTASVSTRGMKDAYYSDSERERMYIDTLIFYIQDVLSNPHYQIVFAENSGWDLSRIISRLPHFDRDRLEFISLDPTEFDITRGKGYNELLMMNLALNKSRILESAEGFVKVTGRYPVFNIRYFIDNSSKYINEGKMMYCDIKDHSIYRKLGLSWNAQSFYSVLYGMNKGFYMNKIADRYVELNDYQGYLVEDMLYDVVREEYSNGRNKFKGDVGGGYAKSKI